MCKSLMKTTRSPRSIALAGRGWEVRAALRRMAMRAGGASSLKEALAGPAGRAAESRPAPGRNRRSVTR